MKNSLLTALLATLLAGAAQAQDQPHKFEVGVEVLNYSPFAKSDYNYYKSRSNNKAHWAPGVVFRYNLNRFGLRSGIGYTTETEKLYYSSCADCPVGETTGKELQLRLGGQYAPFQNAPWLYVFSDFYYRRYTSEGNFTGGLCGCLNTDLGVKSNGVGNSTGIGIKVRTFRHFYLNPEVYYGVLRAQNQQTSTDRNSGASYQSTSRTSLHAPALRLNAILAF